MVEKVCNLWLEKADYRCIPTIGATTPDGEAMMDSGVAKEAAEKFHNIQVDLGRMLTSRGNHVHVLRDGVASFPIKQYAWAAVDVATIVRSAHELVELVGDAKTLLPRPALGANDPTWDTIASALAFLPDNIIVIQHQ